MAKKASGKKTAKKTAKQKAAVKTAARKSARKAIKKSATKAGKAHSRGNTAKTTTSKAAPKLPRKIAKKTAAKPVGKSAKKSAKKLAKNPAKNPPKKLAKKSARKPVKQAAKKMLKNAAATAAGGRPAKRAAPVCPPSRKPVGSIAARKTARSRMAKRASVAPAPLARKLALRISLSRRVALPGEEPGLEAAPATVSFDPAQLGFRPAVKSDWPLMRRLLVEAFGRTDESDLVERLRAGRELAGEFIAEYLGRPAACLAFCTLNVTAGDGPVRAVALAPLAVDAELEGQGVATRLVAYGLENMRGLGVEAVFVLGDPGFYARFGFSARLASRFDSPWSGPRFQALEFEPGVLAGAGGADWPAAFELLP